MRIYNALSKQTQDFNVSNDTVNMYVCGITPYDSAHLGHAMSAVIFDMIRRYFEFKGFNVNYIQNFTDVDDKMINAANIQNIEVSELAEKNIAEYLDELKSLNVKVATKYPKATEEIPAIIELISQLIENNFAYEIDGDVYFRVNSDEDYGKLSNRKIQDLLAGARLEIDENKEFPADFALWKKHKSGEPFWPSPWGNGRPGWHIECSAMALKYLGDSIDIHGGGIDLVFPHHENEIAQSESATGRTPFANFWVHNGTLGYGQEKMSKSIGNVFSISSALEKFSSDSLRMFFLSSHYRSPLIFSDSAINSQEKALDRLRNAIKVESQNGEELEFRQYVDRFIEAMDDDFNTPIALSVLFDLSRDINREATNGKNVFKAQKTLLELSNVLGVKLDSRKIEKDSNVEGFIDLLIDLRSVMRDKKDFETSDLIRDRLTSLGIKLEDSSGKTDWNWID